MQETMQTIWYSRQRKHKKVFLIIIRIGGQMKNVREYRKSVHILRFRSETASG